MGTGKMIKKDKKKKRKKTALVICRDRKQFWTTQAQFWQWMRDGVVIKTADNPLTGIFRREHEELMVLLSNTVLNLAHPNHMREALLSRRVGLRRSRTMNRIGLCLMAIFLTQGLILSQAVLAQQGPEKTPLSQNEVGGSSSAANVTTGDNPDIDTYQIGPGDILEIRVFNRPQLSREAVRVDARGMIRVPLIEEEIRAACRTETELAKELGKRYLEYLRNPSIEVFVKEFQSQPVAVLGAVVTPGRFQLQRRVRLLELLSYAGGPAERAGARIQVIHTSDPELCRDVAADTELTGDWQTDLGSFVSYNLNDTLRGEEQANPYIRPGDIVSLPESEKAFVVGNVFRPATIPLKESITVSQAIAMAGGIMPDTKSEKVRIIRQMAGSTTRTEIFVDLKGIDKRRAEDIVLQPNDIVDVPMSGGKKFLRTLVSAIAPAISNTPIRVIR